jgi:hypothetical protein
MNAIRTPTGASLVLVHLLSQLLERLERSTAPIGAEQYRSVVRHLSQEFGSLQAHDGLSAVLDAHPAAAQLYENLNYRHAGLCRSPLEQSLDAELQARKVIERARLAPRSDAA